MKRQFRFTIGYEKYTDVKFWMACDYREGQMEKSIYYIIYKRGAGFDLFRKAGMFGKRIKLCHVKKFDSAKAISKLMAKG